MNGPGIGRVERRHFYSALPQGLRHGRAIPANMAPAGAEAAAAFLGGRWLRSLY